jgi:hypothetical protein
LEYNESDLELFEGLQLFVTTKVTTPLEWLRRQGELIPPTTQPPEVPMALAIWTPKVKAEYNLLSDEEEMCASDVGRAEIVPYTEFLIGLRSIVESELPFDERLHSLKKYLNGFPHWSEALAIFYRKKPKKKPWPNFLIVDWESRSGKVLKSSFDRDCTLCACLACEG